MKSWLSTPKTAVMILRAALGIIFITHGLMRTYAGTVSNFGEFLDGIGFPLGHVIAWVITVFEMAGGLALIAGIYAHVLALIFAAHIGMGIVLVHGKFGWFVVGHGQNGAEYSFLIVAACLAVFCLRPGRR